jgi:hypothetical protein
MRREKSLRIGVHLANAVVWGPVYRTHLRRDEVDDDGGLSLSLSLSLSFSFPARER